MRPSSEPVIREWTRSLITTSGLSTLNYQRIAVQCAAPREPWTLLRGSVYLLEGPRVRHSRSLSHGPSRSPLLRGRRLRCRTTGNGITGPRRTTALRCSPSTPPTRFPRNGSVRAGGKAGDGRMDGDRNLHRFHRSRLLASVHFDSCRSRQTIPPSPGQAARCQETGDPKAYTQSFNSNFNTAAFGMPLAGTWGNTGLGILRQPATFTLDLSVDKSFKVRRKGQVPCACAGV